MQESILGQCRFTSRTSTYNIHTHTVLLFIQHSLSIFSKCPNHFNLSFLITSLLLSVPSCTPITQRNIRYPPGHSHLCSFQPPHMLHLYYPCLTTILHKTSHTGTKHIFCIFHCLIGYCVWSIAIMLSCCFVCLLMCSMCFARFCFDFTITSWQLCD